MKPTIASSNKTTVQAAILDVAGQLGAGPFKLLVYFASPQYDPETLARTMRETFPTVEQLGCTSAGELAFGQAKSKSLVAMGFGDDMLADAAVELATGLSDQTSIAKAMENLARRFGEAALNWDPKKTLGLVLIDGLSMGEERVLDAIGNLTDISFVGGSSGDDVQFKRAPVFANGRAATDAAVLALLKPRGAFSTLKTQSLSPTSKTLTATKVDEAKRTVLEFDGEPAVNAYARALGVAPADLPAEFMKHPLGLMVSGDPYVRSPQRIDGTSIVFFCKVKEGTSLSVLQTEEIVTETSKALDGAIEKLGSLSGILSFNCILRATELERRGQSQAYAQLFARAPTIGFNTYGEAFIGHVNQTATMVLFGQ